MCVCVGGCGCGCGCGKEKWDKERGGRNGKGVGEKHLGRSVK